MEIRDLTSDEEQAMILTDALKHEIAHISVLVKNYKERAHQNGRKLSDMEKRRIAYIIEELSNV
jgi:folate-dependent phosphoribosylglycinamide formyltransferase PurN